MIRNPINNMALAWKTLAVLMAIKVIGTVENTSAQEQSDRGGSNDYYFSSQIFETVEKKDFHLAAFQFSFIGDYKNALQYADSSQALFGTLTAEDSSHFSKFELIPARTYIAMRAKQEQIVILNEAHHNPRHRVFTLSLLQDLYNAGYRYFGAETLNFADSLLNQRKYPVHSSGWYSVEPQYGELIRQALKIGFHVFAYEAKTLEDFQNSYKREIAQATNIKKVLDKDPDAKILLHAGYDHIREDSIGGTWGKAMAGRLTELTGINPFTINQEIMTERSSLLHENPFYKMVNVGQPSLLINEKGELFAGPSLSKPRFDARLFHARTKLIYGRADWLFLDGKRKPYQVKHNVIPCLVFAYYESEDSENAVPADIIEITNKQSTNTLVLYPGKYKILIKDKQGNLVEKHIAIE